MAEAPASSSQKGGATELTREEERIKILELSAASEPHTKEGDNFYLMNNKWWQQWVEYIQKASENITKDGPSLSEHTINLSVPKRPSSIDNSELVDEVAVVDSSTGMELHDTLMEGRDYILLPEAVWNQFYSWYGGGPVLPRKVISQGQDQKELAVEVYPLRLQLILLPKGDSCTIRISKKENVGQLLRRACDIFNLNSERDSVQIWDYYGHQRHALLNDMDRSLTDANIQMDQDILVEVVDNGRSMSLASHTGSMKINGTTEKDATCVLVEPSKSSLSIAGGLSASRGGSRVCDTEISESQNQTLAVKEPSSTYGTSGVTTRGSTGGLTGLLNLGNTCFMNSAIQCLVHTPEFAKYFQEDYHREINWQNPLGMVGELALAFGELLRKLWAPGRTPIAPRQFKAKLARFAPQFSGYNQHDSQELLAFLLDGLHEDLNRVKHKPYIKSGDADGRPDEEVADEYWAYHTARNDSIIVDVCQGQYKSTLVCPVCNKVSVTFDPFMYLSLPLQPTSTRTMTITVFACDGSALPTTCTLAVSKQGRVRDLLQALSNACSLKPNEMLLVAEIGNHLIKRILDDPLVSLSSIKDDDHLAAYRMPKIATNIMYLRLMHHREDQEGGDAKVTSKFKPCGTPFVFAVSRDKAITSGGIQALVHKMLTPMLRTQNNGQIDVSNTGNSAVSGSTLCSDGTSTEPCDEVSVSNSMQTDGASSALGTSSRLPLQLLDEDSASIDLSVEEKEIKLSSSSASITVYMNWSLDLLQKYDTSHLEILPEVYSGPVTKKTRTEPLSLYTCLEAFLREEPLVPEDMWYCPQCKERRQASKKLDLWRLPEVLVIHLKRFSYSRSMKHKLETFVNFPIHDFDLTNYIANKNNTRRQIYELYALTNHYGGMGSGHYTAYIKLLDENKWYNFDDSHISLMNEDDVKSSAAYVLFYRRVKTDDTSVSNGVQSNAGSIITSQR